jgi:hypothetical protein
VSLQQKDCECYDGIDVFLQLETVPGHSSETRWGPRITVPLEVWNSAAIPPPILDPRSMILQPPSLIAGEESCGAAVQLFVKGRRRSNGAGRRVCQSRTGKPSILRGPWGHPLTRRRRPGHRTLSYREPKIVVGPLFKYLLRGRRRLDGLCWSRTSKSQIPWERWRWRHHPQVLNVGSVLSSAPRQSSRSVLFCFVGNGGDIVEIGVSPT